MRATRHLMEERAGKGVRMSDVAQEAGLSRQALYLHFGSRTGLLLATAIYVDEKEQFRERSMEVCNTPRADLALDRFVAFWARYIPSIYGMAKALMEGRHEDPAAAAAWQDRMSALRGICAMLTSRLADQGRLMAGWSQERAADFIWAMLSIQTWEQLRKQRGWGEQEYIEAMQRVLGSVLVSPAD